MKPATACSRDEGRAEIARLVEAFEKHAARYRDPSFNEANARLDFIDPFWRALGWPVGEQLRLLPERRDVRIETLQDGRYPDYQFQPEGVVAFFCEAKKPAEDLKRNPQHIFQAKSYAWSYNRGERRSPFCVLTDFEEFRFFTATRRPEFTRPWEGLVPEFDLTFENYEANFDRLWDTFSRDAVAGGSLLQFLDKEFDTRQPLNEEFLADLLTWRTDLASAFLDANPSLSESELNEAVQRVLDRTLFVRMMEERGMENVPLLAPARSSSDPWQSLIAVSTALRPRYNGQLFAPHFSDRLALAPTAAAQLLGRLDPATSPYRFNAMDVELLGRIYESYLGHTIRIEDGECQVGFKREYLKDGGIYYTPQPVVDVMVEAVLAPLLRGKTPSQLDELRVLDPACGSGSFLIGAYGYLLRWHAGWYNRRKTQVSSKQSVYYDDVEERSDGTLHVSLAKRAAILRKHIFGVDVDGGAVEVAVLSLYLKLLEDAISPSRQLMLVVRGAILPDLSTNIVCGNTLVGPEVYDNLPDGGWTSDWERRVNPLDWDATFSQAFTAVIGNPPYIKEYQNQIVFDDLRRSACARYYTGKMDIWYAFAQRAMDLLEPEGRHAFIAQNNWPDSHGSRNLRAAFRDKVQFELLIDFHDRMVFRNAGIQTMIYVARKATPPDKYVVPVYRLDNDPGTPLSELLDDLGQFSRIDAVVDTTLGTEVMPFVSADDDAVLSRISGASGFRIDKSEVGQGIIGGPDDAFLFPIGTIFTEHERPILHKHYTSANPFAKGSSENLIAYLTSDFGPLDQVLHPNFYRQLLPFREELSGRREVKKGARRWYDLHWPRDERLFAVGPKLACPTRVAKPSFAYIEDEYYASRAVNMLISNRIDLRYLAGVLNSDVVYYWLRHKGKLVGSLLQVDTGHLLNIPIPAFSQKPRLSEAIVAKTVELSELASTQSSARSDRDVRGYAGRFAGLLRQLNHLVFQLYGLSAEDQKRISRSLGQ